MPSLRRDVTSGASVPVKPAGKSDVMPRPKRMQDDTSGASVLAKVAEKSSALQRPSQRPDATSGASALVKHAASGLQSLSPKLVDTSGVSVPAKLVARQRGHWTSSTRSLRTSNLFAMASTTHPSVFKFRSVFTNILDLDVGL